jgi:hypothetical protein
MVAANPFAEDASDDFFEPGILWILRADKASADGFSDPDDWPGSENNLADHIEGCRAAIEELQDNCSVPREVSCADLVMPAEPAGVAAKDGWTEVVRRHTIQQVKAEAKPKPKAEPKTQIRRPLKPVGRARSYPGVCFAAAKASRVIASASAIPLTEVVMPPSDKVAVEQEGKPEQKKVVGSSFEELERSAGFLVET